MNTTKVKVGIVIVTYNSAEVFALALDSLLRTASDTAFEVAVIDNASAPAQREASRRIFDDAVGRGLPGVYFQQEKNLGFSGGNNIGMEHFLADPAITHICLLNSDVIVTDHWLDYLIEDDKDAIGPLTNASNNEQGIPIAYHLGDRDNLGAGSAALDLPALDRFAEERRKAWFGDVVESDFLSYYCVLFTRRVVEKLGLLDTRFFPGAYEDDDYCLRTLEHGFKMYVARDVYLHHWGSASFGKLDALEAQGFAADNRRRFEEKYGRAWQDRTYLSVTAWKQDSIFAIAQPAHPPLHLETHRLYTQQLDKLVDGLEAYRTHLLHEIKTRRSVQKRDLRSVVFGQYEDEEAAPRSLIPGIESISSDVRQYLSEQGEAAAPEDIERLKARFEHLERDIDALVAETRALLAQLNAIPAVEPKATDTLMSRLTARVARAAQFPGSRVSRIARWLEFADLFFGGNGIMFVAPYPTKARERDGYFQRVKAIDSLFPARRRLYCDVREGGGPKPFIERAGRSAWVLNIALESRVQRLAACLLAWRFKRVYFHSVLRMPNPLGRALLRVPGVKWVLDVHGVVPEEFRMHNDFYSARIHDDCERHAVERASNVIVVSQAMGNYLSHKYRELLKADVIVLPIFAVDESSQASRPYKDGKPTVIYAGGTQKWQNLPAMMNVVREGIDLADWWLYTPDVEQMRSAAAPEVVHHPNFHVSSATRAELNGIYQQCHFGFILRDDMVVNNVSCPTKLIEYLAFGIVPIVDTPNIGDFNTYGMRYVTASDFSAGKIPGEQERMQMARHNMAICEQLVQQKTSGEQQLVGALG
ncbi:polysaccharide pyruvyl transferase [Caballeronia pedi]|uniref:Polysaccharide pyruvyl transferase n=1 Tax=Caballeronia pedi TaxID=1777141 RepID=A0A158BX29_9BURK|nr:glycosyltransferase [Caballeronia pedi]SAK74653.1 polysaccharide pyruvyl transferase [Caballeronia pedi]